ncbi:ADP-ribose pyrophosphatase [Aquabacterium olei]|uniref:ADP-ribose pyrophosphatase n=1 Tax=Aquabacterium olei TaxID=1296669 RepID=A0A2U8FPV6_9BURK|nr:NUDIX domain-containing protein [Aquabacterium olei]AWI53075.1 ADP-ribose pyrophosphatase [Aquabacterium olei]
MSFRFCPQCATPLLDKPVDGAQRLRCPDTACGFVHWDNPVPVVAAIVEHENHIILARNAAWAVPFYALITGFLEKHDPSPEEAVLREVKEELGLDATQPATFVGHYAFPRNNQIILAYHVVAEGTITLNEELVDYKRILPQKLRYWPAATGLALRDWLLSQGHTPEALELPKL